MSLLSTEFFCGHDVVGSSLKDFCSDEQRSMMLLGATLLEEEQFGASLLITLISDNDFDKALFTKTDIFILNCKSVILLITTLYIN